MEEIAKQPTPGAPLEVKMEGNDDVAANKSFLGEQKEDNIFICSSPMDILIPFNTCTILPERTNIVELYFGKYHGTITKPGCYCRNSCSMELRTISTALKTIDLPNTKVIDACGSPLIVSGLVSFEVIDARKAAIDVIDAFKYVQDVAPAILKRVVSQFPYEVNAEVAGHEICLRTGTDHVGNHMREALQKRCNPAGVRIESFAINELSYSPEIAQVMLKRQQADALLDARQNIVDGAKEIAMQTIQEIGPRVSVHDRSRLLSNLLVVLVGEKDVVPTIALGK